MVRVRSKVENSMPASMANVYVCDVVRDVQRLHHDLLTDESRQLPIRDQLDQQSRRILEGHRPGDRAIATHVTCWRPELVGRAADEILSRDFTLDDARQTIAREYGCRGPAGRRRQDGGFVMQVHGDYSGK